MKKLRKKIICGFSLIISLLGPYQLAAQRHPPREIRDTRDHESNPPKAAESEKAERWSKEGKIKESFRSGTEYKPVEQKLAERNPPSRGGRHVENKADKWARGNYKDRFNSAANPGFRKFGDGGSGGRNNPPSGGGVNPPPRKSLTETFNDAANPSNPPPPPPPRRSDGNPGGGSGPRQRPGGPTFKPGGV